MLHALTDAMWVTKKGAVRKDYENLKNLINLKVNQKFPKFFDESMAYEIVIEGIYKWIIFIESKKDKIGVSNRFLGLFDDYKYKIRGIELRRRDTPIFIKEFQAEILEIMKNINSKNDFRKLSKQIWQMFDDYSEKICNGKIPAEKLCVKKRMSKNPLEYKKNTDISQAAQTLIAEGIDINPGESINLIFVQGNQALPYEIFIKNPQPLNTEKYIKLLKESMIILT
jgi:DNA polymerase-2